MLFSSIGIEGYDEDNRKCQRLKKTLNFDCVKRITTRDDFASLQKYKENPALAIDKTADPAVFSKEVFAPFIQGKRKPRKIGIFIIRANAFTDNKIPFTAQQAAEFWLALMDELERRGYSYSLLTSGHFGDEAFLDYLIRRYNVPESKCVFNINCPEDLFQNLSPFSAVVSCRLHPSIISYSMGIPSISLVWNGKVRGFYESIGFPDRAVETDGIDPQRVADLLERVIDEGVVRDPDYIMSVYRNLYLGIRDCIPASFPHKPSDMYSLEKVLASLPPYAGTTSKELDTKMKRKYRRTYEKYNDVKEKYNDLKEKYNDLKEKYNDLKEKHNDDTKSERETALKQ